jgi:tRNA(Ile)-lysidine synthase
MDPIRRRVLEAAAALPKGLLVVALSGGADSAVAAWAACQRSGQVAAAHVHHSLPTSDEMQAAATAIAGRLGVDLMTRTVIVEGVGSWEDAARRARYRALQEMAGSAWLVTGHTSDDQAETVLMAVLRGAGVRGLAGVPARRDRIIRPLLGVSRSETRRLATALGLPWRDDPSDVGSVGRRTDIRRFLIPDLEGRYNRALRPALNRMAESVGHAADVVEALADQVHIGRGDGGVAIAAADITTRSEAVGREVVRRALRLARGPHAGSHNEVLAIMEVARGSRRGAVLSGGLVVGRRGALVVIETGDTVAPSPVDWAVPGPVRYGSWELDSWVETAPPVAFPLGAGWAVLDGDLVGDTLAVRPLRHDDRVAVPGGHALLVDVMASAGVDRADRDSWPVVMSGGDLLWVPWVRVIGPGVGQSTTRYLWLAALRGEPWR